MIVARCVSENSAGVAAERIAGDWWNATYVSTRGPVPWAKALFGSTFPEAFAAGVKAKGASSPGAKPLSDARFQGQFIMQRDGDGCGVPPRSLTILRRISASWRLPAYSAGNLAAALSRATVDGAPFGSLPWHRPAFERRFPDYFRDGGSGTRSGSGGIIDPTTTATLELDEVTFRTNAPEMVGAAAASSTVPLSPSPADVVPSLADPSGSRELDGVFSTLVVPVTPPVLQAAPGAIPEPTPGANPGLQDAGEVDGQQSTGGTAAAAAADVATSNVDRIRNVWLLAAAAGLLLFSRARKT